MDHTNVVDLSSFKKRKQTNEEFASGRKPLFISHLNGQVTGSPNLNSGEGTFGERLVRVRQSLEKIGTLMSELKRIAKQEQPESSSVSFIK